MSAWLEVYILAVNNDYLDISRADNSPIEQSYFAGASGNAIDRMLWLCSWTFLVF